jgi:enoyl-CoA hydratase
MSSIRTTRDGAVAVVTLSRPPANAMDAASLVELAEEIDRLGREPDVDAIVLTGEGRTFSAGLDLKAITDLDADGQEALIEGLNRAFLAVFECPRLVVAAVNGHAIAGGLILALCCDVRLVADIPLRAALAEVTVGVVYPVGAIEVVRHELAGAARRRLVLRGDPVDAAEGVALGVFDRVVPADELLDAALAEARDSRPPVAYARIKAQLRRPAIEAMRAVLGGRDPLTRPWLAEETFAAAAAALRR